jgi:tetratricopeptide (TPR) repeat protein
MLLAQFGDADLTEGADESTWPTLRQSLETTGLIQAEYLPNIAPPYLKFHPTLAPVLWPQLSADEQTDLRTRHRQRYYQLSGYLYVEDKKNPLAIRAIARRELPNLMSAVRCAIAANDPDAVAFITNVNQFLMIFGLGLDRQELTNQLEQLQGEAGSQTWYLARSNEGEALMGAGQVAEALAVFREVLAGLGDAPSYERCLTLNRIGRCLRAQGQATQAAECYRAAIAVAEQLAPSAGVTRQRGLLYTDLGDVLTDRGDFAGARSAYETSLAVVRELGDDRNEAVVNGQLGALALVQGDLAEAETRYKVALETFQQLQEPASEATVWHQLGRVYEEVEEWEAADRHYRESARIKEAQGNLAGAARTWNQLAIVSEGAGRVEAAKSWYEKAIEGGKAAQDWLPVSRALNNLADLLQSQPNPSPTDLATARQHAEAALAINQTLDPAAAEIWKNYTILAEIAEKQGRESEARAYRQQARQAKANYAGTQHELKQYAPLIAGVVMAVDDAEVRSQLMPTLDALAQPNPNFVAAVRRILDGDRDETTLFDSLGSMEAAIIQAILQGIADPSNLPPQ